MNLKNNKWVWYGITTLIFAVLIYVADVNKFIEAILSSDPYYLSIALVFGLGWFLFFGVIWHLFLTHMGIPVTFYKSLKLVMGGVFMNSITPLGPFGGEPFMAYVVSKNSKASYEKAISCIISADIVNTVPFVTYSTAGIVYFVLFRSVNNFIINLAAITGLLIVIGSIAVYLLWFEEEILERNLFKLMEKIETKIGGEKYVQKVKEKISEIKSAFQTVGESPRHLIKTIFVGHLAMLSQFICLYFILLSQNIEPLIIPIYFTVILSGFATISPTPGGSGTFEAAFAGLLLFFYTVPFDTAVAIAVLFRLTTYWPGILIGYLSLINLQGGTNR